VLNFKTQLVKPAGTGTWTYAPLPPEINSRLEERGLVKVKGTINGIPIRSSLMPLGDGSHYIVVNKAIREKAGIEAGDPVDLELEIDREERLVEAPPDLVQAFNENPQARGAFEKLSYSHRKEYVDYINEAKKSETRFRRIEKSITMLLDDKKLK
jgi:hypothetical protein